MKYIVLMYLVSSDLVSSDLNQVIGDLSKHRNIKMSWYPAIRALVLRECNLRGVSYGSKQNFSYRQY